MKLGLGTAQFGLDYGISNQEGRTSPEEVRRILDFAASNRVSTIDTAPAYGDSESVVGQALAPAHLFRVATKTPPSLRSADDQGVPAADRVEASLLASLRRLKRSQVDALLVHHAEDLLSSEGAAIFGRLQELKARGLCRKTGASVYTADQIDELLGRFSIDVVQLPFSVFDQRLECSGHLSTLKAAGVEIHARSIFLQGLLLMKPEDLPPHFAPARARLIEFRKRCAEQGIGFSQAALGFVMSNDRIDTVICGVNSLNHLKELVRVCRAPGSFDFLRDLALTAPEILNPALWPPDVRRG